MIPRARFKIGISFALFILLSELVFGQEVSQGVVGQVDGNRTITTAVPFLAIAPDARGSSLGFSGVATEADFNSVHWNNAKLAFVNEQFGASISYMPWLRNLTNDMYVGYLSGYWKIDDLQTIGASFRYFDRGDFDVLDAQSNIIGDFSPNELAFDATYSRKLTDKIGLGFTLRYVISNIRDVTNPDQSGGSEGAVSTDLGFYYRTNFGERSELSFGGHISNLGPKIQYIDSKYFLPVNLRIGTAYKRDFDEINSVTISLDFNKFLVPTPPEVVRNLETGDFIIVDGRNPDRSLLSGVFGSFGDAANGFSEELQEISISFGAEYWYKDLASFRLGYFGEHEEKGDRKIITTGLGFRYKEFGLDLSYLIPTSQNHPLGETLQLTVSAAFDRKNE